MKNMYFGFWGELSQEQEADKKDKSSNINILSWQINTSHEKACFHDLRANNWVYKSEIASALIACPRLRFTFGWWLQDRVFYGRRKGPKWEQASQWLVDSGGPAAGLSRTPLLALDLLWFSFEAEWHRGAGGGAEGGVSSQQRAEGGAAVGVQPLNIRGRVI